MNHVAATEAAPLVVERIQTSLPRFRIWNPRAKGDFGMLGPLAFVLVEASMGSNNGGQERQIAENTGNGSGDLLGNESADADEHQLLAAALVQVTYAGHSGWFTTFNSAAIGCSYAPGAAELARGDRVRMSRNDVPSTWRTATASPRPGVPLARLQLILNNESTYHHLVRALALKCKARRGRPSSCTRRDRDRLWAASHRASLGRLSRAAPA